ncbi:MAG: hypothetical protein J6W35_01710 [Eubacterium sp.]|nr:hypothetical protein [Eubacterium sp.]
MSKSRTVNTSKNIITGIGNKVILLLLTFISRKIFIEYIGVQYLGINSLFANVLTILSMADMGFGIAMSYTYYKPLAENDHIKLAALVRFYRKVYNVIASAVFVIGLAIMPFLKYIVNLDKPIDHLYIYYLFALLTTVCSYLFVYKSNIISADQKNFLINKISIYVTIGKIAIQIVTMIVFKNYMIFAALDLLATVVNNLIISHLANKYYPYIKNKEKLSKEDKKNIFANMRSVFLYKFSANIMGGTDSIIMSSIVGTVVVGMYTNYLTITVQVIQFSNILFSSFTASIGNLIIENKPKKNHFVFNVMQMASQIISGIIAVCILLLADDFITNWLGAKYAMGILMVFAVAANTYFTIVLQPIWSYREATGLYNKTKYVMVATAVVNIILSIVMGYWIGAPGIVLATVLSRLLTYFWYEPALIYKLYFKEKSWPFYREFLIGIALMAFGYFCCSGLFRLVFKETNWTILVVKAIISVAFMGLLYFLRYFKTEEFQILKARAIDIKNKKFRRKREK